MQEFSLLFPKTWEEASGLLAKYSQEGRVLAGGTDLLPKLRLKELPYRYLVSIRQIADGASIRNDDGGLSIAAGATLSAVETVCTPDCYSNLPKAGSNGVGVAFAGQPAPGYGVLAQAAGYVGATQIRNRATLAGNLCNSSPAADTIPAFLILDAVVKIKGPQRLQEVPVSAFLRGPGQNILETGEIVQEIFIPAPAADFRAVYLKFARVRSMDIATCSVAVGIRLTEDGLVSDAKIAVGAAAPVPFRAARAEQHILGKPICTVLAREAAELAAQQGQPIGDIRASAAYRLELIRVLTEQAIMTFKKEEDK